MENRFAGLVRGPSAVFPRGILWLIPVWYGAIALALLISKQAPSWYAPAIQIGLALAALTALAVLATIRSNAFVADETCIWLGLRAGAARRWRRREVRQLPWQAISQVTIVARSYGARLDVQLDPAARLISRAHPVTQVAASLLLVLLPFSYLGRSPGIVHPHTAYPPPGPVGFRIPLYDVTASQLRQALTTLAPADVPITVKPRLREIAYRRLREGTVLRLRRARA